MNDKKIDYLEYAFPSYAGRIGGQEGMTRRQWLAGLTIQGIMANEWPGDNSFNEIARRAYAIADAMLAFEKKESQ